SIHLWGSSGRDWNTSTQVNRYSDSGSTQSSGAAATSVEICTVTAIKSPDGTAARKIQRTARLHTGAAAWLSAATTCPATEAGERHSNRPQAPIRTIKTA